MGLGAESVLGGLVHPGLHEALPLFYPTTAMIQAGTQTRRPNGEIVMTWETVLTATGNLARAPRTELETRGGAQTVVPAGWVLNLAGYFPEIEVEQRAVTADGQVFNIVAVIHDSLSGSTKLEVERVTH